MFSFHLSKTLIMGILNVTPDSFSDGGENFLPENALEKARQMENDGADIIDIGAVSTAPKSTPVSEEEEIARLGSVLPLVTSAVGIPVSVDTVSPAVAEFALSHGAVIVNDESGFFNEKTAGIVKKYNAGWVFMHTGGCSSKETAVYPNGVVCDVLSFFKEMKEKALSFGISENSLCFDYGIGFGKSRKDDISLLKNTDAFGEYKPLLVGVSRKRVIGEITGRENPKDRVFGTVAANTLAVYGGAGILRVHDVKAAADTVKICNALKRDGFYE